jgi:hypothetical protein
MVFNPRLGRLRALLTVWMNTLSSSRAQASAGGSYLTYAKAEIAVVLSMVLLAVGTLLSAAWHRDFLIPDPTEVVLRRLAPLRTALPSRGTVGYLSDSKPGMAFGRAHCMVQYALAPVVVAKDAGWELVVANFSSPAAAWTAANAMGFAVVEDLHNGVALLRRRPASRH